MVNRLNLFKIFVDCQEQFTELFNVLCGERSQHLPFIFRNIMLHIHTESFRSRCQFDDLISFIILGFHAIMSGAAALIGLSGKKQPKRNHQVFLAGDFGANQKNWKVRSYFVYIELSNLKS